MPVNRHQLINELEVKLLDDDEITDNVADVGRQVEFHWKWLANDYLDAGYATGEYRASIHRESVRATRAEGGNRGGWRTRVVTFDPIAHLLEYGTGPDKHGTGSWFGKDGEWHTSPDTPTPAFALAATVERDMSGTIAARGNRKIRNYKFPFPVISRGGRPTNNARAAAAGKPSKYGNELF